MSVSLHVRVVLLPTAIFQSLLREGLEGGSTRAHLTFDDGADPSGPDLGLNQKSFPGGVVST